MEKVRAQLLQFVCLLILFANVADFSSKITIVHKHVELMLLLNIAREIYKTEKRHVNLLRNLTEVCCLNCIFCIALFPQTFTYIGNSDLLHDGRSTCHNCAVGLFSIVCSTLGQKYHKL
jgi:hypothetical protein